MTQFQDGDSVSHYQEGKYSEYSRNWEQGQLIQRKRRADEICIRVKRVLY